MQSNTSERSVHGVTGWRAFLGAESGAATLDWIAVAAGGVVAAVLVVAFIGEDAIGVVHEMNDRDAAHEAAVAAVAERERRRALEAATAEPLRHYYPDAPEAAAGEAGAAPALSVDTRAAARNSAFDPAIAEPEIVETAAVGPQAPVLGRAIREDAPFVPREDDAEARADPGCIAAVRDNPFVSESLVATAGCDAAAGPVLAEPKRTDGIVGAAAGFETSIVIVEEAPAFAFEVPDGMAGCDADAADNPFLSESLRASAGCGLGATTH